MDCKWIYFTILIFGVSTVTAQDTWDDYGVDWWSGEAEQHQLGNVETHEEAPDAIAEYYESIKDDLGTIVYKDDAVNAELDEKNDNETPIDDVAEQIDEEIGNNDSEFSEDGDDTVQQDIKLYKENLSDEDEAPQVDESFDDYQIEDNRSKADDDKIEKDIKEEQNDEDDENEDSDSLIEQMLETSSNEEPSLSEFEDNNAGNDEILHERVHDDTNSEEETEKMLDYDLDEELEPEGLDYDSNQGDITNLQEVNRLLNENNGSFEEDIDQDETKSNDDDNDKKIETPTSQEGIVYGNDMINANDNLENEKLDDVSDDLVKDDSEANDHFDIASHFMESEENDKDSVAKAYAELHEDLNNLYETWNKLFDESEEDKKVVAESESESDTDELIEDSAGDFLYEEEDDIFKDEAMDDVENSKLINNDQSLQDEEPIVEIEIINYKLNDTEDEPIAPKPIKTIDVKDLNPAQYDDLMIQFVQNHEEVNPYSGSFSRNIAARHMPINTDDVVEITSPNYPNTYPTNNVVDWILRGEGSGVELNITDLQLRGAQDDFLLIIPGGIDDSTSNGLVFSFHLNEPRKFRFTDVNQVFIRFQSGAGLGFLRGFKLTVKSIWPPRLHEADPIPEPEALLPPPAHTLKVILGGLAYSEFSDVQDEFRRLLADMAIMYINSESIDLGVNTTSEVTQITTVGMCNINWPNFEECVEVTFGVPLVYEGRETSRLNLEDLKIMWETYVSQDPFAARLRSMGITEFAVPNDGRIILVWLVLVAGVFISVTLLALALWRYSCFEDYTRMKSFSDTDSLREEKRGLDLYPTPHQNLPPLYHEVDMKWADEKYNDSGRVDIGGFTNRSYIRDDMFDIDSDDDVVPARERSTGIKPRDMYQV